MQHRSPRAGLLVIGLTLGLAPPVIARPAGTDALAAEISRLVSGAKLGEMRVGLSVVALGPDPTVVYEYHAQEAFKPASNQKLITAAAAIDVLGEAFVYRTILARRGDDLLIIGSGDPSVGDPRIARAAGQTITALFHRWADRLEARGITTIPGRLLFDDSIFDQEFVHASWRGQHNLETSYAAGVGGLNFNDNCVDLVIKPADAQGKPALVTLIPNTPWVQLENKSRTAAKGEPIVRRLGTGPITISITGSVSKPNSAEHPLSVPVTDPGAFLASTCRTVLAARGIRIIGENRRQRIRRPDGTLPSDIEVLAIHETRPIDILWRLNKSSQNVFAEAFLKTMGAYAGRIDKPGVGTCENGRVVIRGFLKRIGVSPDTCVLDDGCGLSHANRTTPAALTAILCYMDRHPRRRQWWSSLAVPGGQMGTLRRRLTSLKGSLFAKTGYIGGVSTLSGYVVGPGERGYAFSILCNNTHKTKGGTSAARKLQEAVCRTLATWDAQTSDSN